MRKNQAGFTLVEIGVVVPIIMLIAIGLFVFMFSYLLSSNREQTRLNQLYTQSNALGRIEADVRLTNGFLATNDGTTPDFYDKYSSGQASWNYAGAGTSGPRVLILREYATTGNPLASTRTPVFLSTGTSSNCSQASDYGQPLTYDIVYFVANKTLYRRILTNTTSVDCSQQYQQTSCPSLTTLGASSRDGSCHADDEVLATGVSNFLVSYYDSGSTDTSSPLDAYTNQSLLNTALSVNVTITSTGRTYGDPVTSTTSLRMTTKNYTNGGTS